MATVLAPAQISLQRILVAVDFSPCSEVALHYAAALTRRQQGKIFLAHVLPMEAMYPFPVDPMPIDMDTDQPLRHMQQMISAPELADVACEMLAERGELWQVLDDMVRMNKIDLVVVGTRGREGLKKLFLGSAAEQVFRRATCPVLTVGPHVAPECLENGLLRRVVYATDFTASSLHALPYVLQLAQQHQARITLVHALACGMPASEFGPTTFSDREMEAARAELRQLLPPGIAADLVVQVGIPAEIIVAVAEQQKASLIVMGLHAQSVFAATHLPWTTAHRIVCDAHCPVLTVR